LPPGRFKLATKPDVTGSPVVKMIGFVVVASLAARVAGGPPAKIATTLLLIRSAARNGKRSY